MTNQLSASLLAAAVYAGCAVSACEAKEAPTQKSEPTDAASAGDSPDGSLVAPGALDRRKLGKECTNSGDCDGGGCYEFGSEPPTEGAHCVDVVNGCQALVCPSGYICVATGGDPSSAACNKRQ